MSIEARLAKIESAAKALEAEEDKLDGPDSIVRFLQKQKIPFAMWPMMMRQHAVSFQLPVYGEVFPQQLVSFTTPEIAAFYRQHHREPWDPIETDHPAYYGEWERFSRKYDAGEFWHGQNNGVIRRAGEVEQFPPGDDPAKRTRPAHLVAWENGR